MHRNIYEMYIANGNKADFWVRRNSWNNTTFARVVSVAGQQSGRLFGVLPHFQKQEVICDFYRDSKLKQQMQMSYPETYSYWLIDCPMQWLLS